MITGKEPAFPLNAGVMSDYDFKAQGLNKREYLAAMCLQGILANSAFFEIFANSGKRTG